ncbi:MAG: hypothetical protein ACO1RX_19505 [Candidatus Sericytochromatia bacterium]
MNIYVIIRIFVEMPLEKAQNLSSQMEAQLSYPLTDLTVEAYYKFDDWHEISGVFLSKESTQNQALQAICLKLGSGWVFTWGETDLDFSADAIWNPGPNCHFIWPETRFAHVLVSPDYGKGTDWSQWEETEPIPTA